MLRPEAWFLAAMYWVWVAWKATWRERFLFAALAASGPLAWATVDYLVTGDPLFSLQLHGRLGRGSRPPAPALGAARARSRRSSRTSSSCRCFAAAGVGAVLGVVISPRRMLMPIVLLRRGAGDVHRDRRRRRVGDRALPGRPGAGADGARGGRDRRLDDAAAGLAAHASGWSARSLIVVFGVAYTATRLNLSRFDNELRFRGQAHDDLTEVLNDPKVKAGLRCGPLTGPNHKIVPDTPLDRRPRRRQGARARVDRADRAQQPTPRGVTHGKTVSPVPRTSRCAQTDSGVAIVVTSRFAIFKHAWTDAADDARIQVPPPGFTARQDDEVLRRVCPLLASGARWRAGRARSSSAARSLVVAVRCALIGACKTGLPYVYNADENSHFVPRAIGMFGHGLNPDYFINPPAYTYVAARALHACAGGRTRRRSAARSRPTRRRRSRSPARRRRSSARSPSR